MDTLPFAPPRNVLARGIAELRSKAFPHYWSAAERWAVGRARQTRCDLVLCLTQSLREDVLAELKRHKVRRLAAWWGDPPANMRGMGLLSDAWDAIFLKDALAVRKFRTVGLHAELLHEAFNPDWHQRRFGAIGGEIVVAGNYYGYRQFIVRRLIEAGLPVALYGFPPPRWADPTIKAAHRGSFIVRMEKSAIFGSGIACLNSTTLAEGDSLNCRAFEIAGACGLHLIEDRPAVAGCFEPGTEVLVYRSIDDITEFVAKAQRDPAWALSIREAGSRRAHAEHSYRQRLELILRRVKLMT
ncbi:spore maturation protein CgeB [Rhodoligotrophos appendicifer]